MGRRMVRDVVHVWWAAIDRGMLWAAMGRSMIRFVVHAWGLRWNAACCGCDGPQHGSRCCACLVGGLPCVAAWLGLSCMLDVTLLHRARS